MSSLLEKEVKLIKKRGPTIPFGYKVAEKNKGYFEPIQSELDFKNADVNNPDFEKYAGRYGESVKEWKDKGDK